MTDSSHDYVASKGYRNAFLVAAALWGISFQFLPVTEISGITVKVQHCVLLFFAVHAVTTKALSGRFGLRVPYFLLVLIWFYIIVGRLASKCTDSGASRFPTIIR